MCGLTRADQGCLVRRGLGRLHGRGRHAWEKMRSMTALLTRRMGKEGPWGLDVGPGDARHQLL